MRWAHGRGGPPEIFGSRQKVVAAWQAAIKENPLAKKILESQTNFMKKLGVLA